MRICKKCHKLHFGWKEISFHLSLCLGKDVFRKSEVITMIDYPDANDKERYIDANM